MDDLKNKVEAVLFATGRLLNIEEISKMAGIGSIGHLPLTILTMLLLIIGVQIILFGFLADMRKE